MKRYLLLQLVKQNPKLTAKQYAELANRPHPSVRRDLAQLAKEGVVQRVETQGDGRRWDGTSPVGLTWIAA